ncbi:GerMN domain-containing protein [Paractinoplanes hotanensis]|uniref:GerMN domain-containing protein n=1 Tax=Paractinoplanes hotanensis TaxID=2906497 RepID=A0ABT0YCP4_9ACTN|nr:GerMN domain-containing protein [Actinoplanes hotanensis]MCM4083841.1 GerMN domain-containing protein [Actinoplanes hotanensis]
MRRVPLLMAVLTTVLLTACGVPAQDDPHPVDLPRRPLTASSDSEATASSPPGEVAHVLCLVRGDRLVQIVRRARAYPSVQEQLDELVAGPTGTESESGLSTALAGLVVTASAAPGSRIAVEAAEIDEGSGRSNEILAYGQVVCTLTARADVSAVSFTRAGRRLDVPRADGILTGEPLRASDYVSLLGPA